MRGERVQILLIAGHNRPASKTSFNAGGPMMEQTLNAGNSGNWTSAAKEPYGFVIFQGGGVQAPSPPPPLDPCMHVAKSLLQLQL